MKLNKIEAFMFAATWTAAPALVAAGSVYANTHDVVIAAVAALVCGFFGYQIGRWAFISI